MTGIVACGAWIPARRVRWRCSRARRRRGRTGACAGLGRRGRADDGGRGARDCLRERERGDIELLLFASTTVPTPRSRCGDHRRRVGLAPGVRTWTWAVSLRGGTQALLLALDAVRAGSRRGKRAGGGVRLPRGRAGLGAGGQRR